MWDHLLLFLTHFILHLNSVLSLPISVLLFMGFNSQEVHVRVECHSWLLGMS